MIKIMTSKIVLYFPTNYRHGNLSKDYYKEEISILSVSPRTSDFINEIFKDTKLYKKLKFFSYNLYIEWKERNNIFIAYPKITVFYKDKKLAYFHVPTYNDVKFDFYLLTGEKNDIVSNNDLIIEDKILVGRYILSLD